MSVVNTKLENYFQRRPIQDLVVNFAYQIS